MSSKKRGSSNLADSSDSDSGPEDRNPVNPPPKRISNVQSGSSRPGASVGRGGGGCGGGGSSAAKKPRTGGDPSVDGQEPTWELGKMKKVKVRVFKGQTYIDIREYYIDKSSMDERPGKKGISLNCQQYQALKAVLDEVDQHLP